MSHITITSKNYSDFSKRLKKSVKKNLGQEITLNQAKLLIAEMIGCQSIHEAQKWLELESKINQSSRKSFFLDKVEMLPNPDNLKIIELAEGYEKRYVQYAIVKNDFIERCGLPYYINDPQYSYVNLFGESATFVNSFQEAKEILLKNPDKMILQYAKPALSHMENHLPICGVFWMYDSEIKSACSYQVNNPYPQPIED